MTKRDATQFALRVSRKDDSSTSASFCGDGTFVGPSYRKLVQAFVIVLLLFTPLIFPWRIEYMDTLTYRFSSFLVPKEAFVHFFVVLAACCWLVAMVWDGALRFRSNALLLPLAVLAALAGISVAYSPRPYSSAIDVAKMFTLVVFFLIVLNNFTDRRSVRIGFQALFLSGLVVAILSLVQLAGGLTWLFPHYEGNPQRMYSTFGNDSGVAGYLLPVLPVGIGLFLTAGSGRLKSIYFAGMLAVAYTIMACQTRGVWLGTFVALVFLLGSMARRSDLRATLGSHRAYVIVGLVLLVIFFAVQSVLPGASSGETDTLARVRSAFTLDQPGVNLRGVFWGAALLMAADRPVFGFGLGTYKYYVQQYQGKLMAALGPMSRLQPNELDTITAHNDFLQLTSELGCAGIAVVLWGFFVLWRCVRRTLGQEMAPDSRCMLLASLSGLIGVTVFAGTNFPFHIVTHALVVMFLLAVVSGAGTAGAAICRKWRAPEDAVSRVALSVCIITVGAAFLCFVVRPYAADYHVASAAAIESAEPDSGAALERLEQAVRIEPRNGLIRAKLGREYLKRGMIDEAKIELICALEDYDSVWVHINLGAACEVQGDFDEAAQHFLDVVFRAPRYGVAHERLAGALIKAGRYEQAQKRCEEALRWVGEIPELVNPLALATYKVGGKKRCIALLRKSLEIRSDQGEIRRFLERVETEIDKNMTERSP